jgi:hypothetical protein
VTAVVSLNPANEYEGGLYITTGHGQASLLELDVGDVAMHQSDLLHGVKVASGTRWSWVIWFSNHSKCAKSAPAAWKQIQSSGEPIETVIGGSATAESKGRNAERSLVGGDVDGGGGGGGGGRGGRTTLEPVSLFLQAHRVHLAAGISQAVALRQKYDLLLASARLKFPRAMNEVGVALMDGTGTAPNPEAARMWFRRAWKHGEPDALYNEGLLHLAKPAEAVELFHRASDAGSDKAFFNLGVAYQRGVGGTVLVGHASHSKKNCLGFGVFGVWFLVLCCGFSSCCRSLWLWW